MDIKLFVSFYHSMHSVTYFVLADILQRFFFCSNANHGYSGTELAGATALIIQGTEFPFSKLTYKI